MKVALITGITGQDGSYLAEFLLEKGYQVWGIIRRSSSFNTQRIEHIFSHPSLFLRYGDLTDSSGLSKVFSEIRNQYRETLDSNGDFVLEVYNLGAMSHVKVSFDVPEYCGETDAIGVLRLLDAIVSSDMKESIRFVQASTSEMYGKIQEIPQTEMTPFYPRSPYGVAKVYGYWITKVYREAYNLFACNTVAFNHESSRRGQTFVTRKITIGLGKICRGEADRLVLGNLDALRDWGHSKAYVEGMWLALQADSPDDYVLATGEMHSVREFVEKAFSLKGFDIKWKGSGVDEIGYDSHTGRELIFVSEKYFRPAEVDQLLGDSTKARTRLGWNPKITFDELLREMVEHDCQNTESEV